MWQGKSNTNISDIVPQSRTAEKKPELLNFNWNKKQVNLKQNLIVNFCFFISVIIFFPNEKRKGTPIIFLKSIFKSEW